MKVLDHFVIAPTVIIRCSLDLKGLNFLYVSTGYCSINVRTYT